MEEMEVGRDRGTYRLIEQERGRDETLRAKRRRRMLQDGKKEDEPKWRKEGGKKDEGSTACALSHTETCRASYCSLISLLIVVYILHRDNDSEKKPRDVYQERQGST